MLSIDYTTEETEYYSSSSPSEDSGDPFRQHLNSDPFRHQLNSIPSSDSDDDSGDESDSPAPSPKIQKIKQQQQMQRSLPPSSFNNGSAFGDEETADGRRKRPRAQGNGVPEPPTKKKMTVKHREEIAVKGQNKAQKQKVTGDASTSKEEEEARKQIGVEIAGASKAKKEVQKQSFAEIASGSKEEKKKKQKQTVAENGNTSKETKKVQKQNVVESVSPPSSPQHSSKKSSQLWSPADELAFFHGVLSYSKRGNGLPSIMAPVYNYVRPMLSTQYNNSQLYNKFRWGRNKFHSITAKIEANYYSFKKNKYEFDNSHPAALYELWAKLWGKEDNGGDEHGNHVEQEQAVSASGNCKGKKKQHADAEEVNASVGSKGKKKKDVEAEEEDTHKISGEEDQRQKEEDEEDVPTSKKTLSHALSKLKGGDMTITRKMYNQFCEERDASLKELKSVVQKIFEDSHSEVKTMLEGRLHQR